MSTGNSLIDYDMGNNSRSPKFLETEPIVSTIRVLVWNSEMNQYDFEIEYELEDTAVSKNELLNWIKDNEDINNIFEEDIQTIKNECDYVILDLIITKNEKVRYEFYY
jgi:hypothetical protein